MADEESRKSEPEIVSPTPGPLPGREPRRDPGVIEGEATEIRQPETPEPEAPAAEEPTLGAGAAPSRRAAWPFLTALVGAVVGAAIALAAAWFLDPRAGALDAADSRLNTLQHEAEGQTGASAALDKRLRALEANEAGAAKAVAVDALGRRVAALEGGTSKNDAAQSALDEARAARADAAKALTLAGSAGAGKAATPADESALEARVGKLESDLAAMKAAINPGVTQDRLGKLETALAAPKSEARLAASEAPPSGGAGAAVLAISLVDRLDSGAPYAAELAALTRLGADGAKLAALKPFADAGAPTVASLGATFAKVAPAVAAAAAPREEGGVMDRLVDHMRKLVRVHKVGEAVDDDPEALTSHVSEALARGDLAAALDAYQRLSPAAQRAAGDWDKQAQARLAASQAALALRADAVGRLATARD